MLVWLHLLEDYESIPSANGGIEEPPSCLGLGLLHQRGLGLGKQKNLSLAGKWLMLFEVKFS